MDKENEKNNKLPELERRSYEFDVRAENGTDGNVITGRPIVYNSRTDLGWFDEIIESGALDRTDLSDVRFLVNHDVSSIPLASSRAAHGNSTMQIYTDSEGMGIRVKLDTERNEQAKALYSAVERGDISGMSFMFSIKDEEWDDMDSDHPTRRIKNIKSVIEVSAVTFPAYQSTEINARDAKKTLENARAALESAKSENRAAVETAKNNELSLLKEKTKILGGISK